MKTIIVAILSFLFTFPIISRNNTTVPTQGLVLYFPFNGNANDASGNGFNGTVVGATLTTDRFGTSNSAYSFDGYTSTIRCGDILDSVFSDSVAKFSVSGWAETRVFGSFQTGGGFIIGKEAGGTYGPYQWGVSHVGGLIIGSVFSDTAIQNYVELACPMTTNQWFHFVLVFDGSLPDTQRVKLYVDGQTSNVYVYQQQGTLSTTTTNSAQNLTIGASHAANQPDSPGNFYDGNIDDIRIYNRALSADEITTLYNEGQNPAHAANLQNVYEPNAGITPLTSLIFSRTGSYSTNGAIDSVFWFVNGSLVSGQPSLLCRTAQERKTRVLHRLPYRCLKIFSTAPCTLAQVYWETVCYT